MQGIVHSHYMICWKMHRYGSLIKITPLMTKTLLKSLPSRILEKIKSIRYPMPTVFSMMSVTVLLLKSNPLVITMFIKRFT